MSRASSPPTKEHVRAIFSYNQITGLLYRLVCNNWRWIGLCPPSHNSYGYKQVCVNNRNYLMHRVIWLYVHGVWPEKQVDHINGIRDDNRLCNLRLASHLDNCHNRASTGKSGVVGVSWHKRHDKWIASIKCKGRSVHLGYFNTKPQAKRARKKAEAKYFGEFRSR